MPIIWGLPAVVTIWTGYIYMRKLDADEDGMLAVSLHTTTKKRGLP